MSQRNTSTPRTLISSLISNKDYCISQRKNSKPLLKTASSILSSSCTNLKIKLIEPVLFLRGNSRESLGCFLRGELILTLKKPTKIKKLELKFNGISKTFWPEGRIYYGSSSNNNDPCEERKLISKNWTFLSHKSSSSHPSSLPSKGHVLLRPNVYAFPFELFIPGDLPETIETDLGSVSYKLSATLFRPGLLSNLHMSQNVPIVRTSISEEINSEGIVTIGDWKNLLGYEIMIPKKSYPIGQLIEIDMKLIPKVKSLDFVELKVQLVETCIYKSKGYKNQESKILKVLKIEDLDKQINQLSNDSKYQIDNILKFIYHKNISFLLPEPSKKIHSSCDTTSISIIHTLKFIYTIKIPCDTNIDGDDDFNSYEDNNIITITNNMNNDVNEHPISTRSSPSKKKKINIKFDLPIILSSCKGSDDLPQYETINYEEKNNRFLYFFENNSTLQTSPPNYRNFNNDNGDDNTNNTNDNNNRKQKTI